METNRLNKTGRYTTRVHKTAFAILLTAGLTAAASVETEDRPSAVTRVELVAVADARTQGGAGDVNYPDGYLHVSTPNGHAVFLGFNLSELPEEARIQSARLRLTVTGQHAGTSKEIELGTVEGRWREGRVTWNNQPEIQWTGRTRTITDDGQVVRFDITNVVRSWRAEGNRNFGHAVRGTEAGVVKSFYSRETGDDGQAPTLVVRYTMPTGPDVPEVGGSQPNPNIDPGVGSTGDITSITAGSANTESISGRGAARHTTREPGGGAFLWGIDVFENGDKPCQLILHWWRDNDFPVDQGKFTTRFNICDGNPRDEERVRIPGAYGLEDEYRAAHAVQVGNSRVNRNSNRMKALALFGSHIGKDGSNDVERDGALQPTPMERTNWDGSWDNRSQCDAGKVIVGVQVEHTPNKEITGLAVRCATPIINR